MSRTSPPIGPRSCLYVFLFLTLFLVRPLDAQPLVAGGLSPHPRLVSVTPTPLFAREGKSLLQVIEVTVENWDKPQEMSLAVEAGSFTPSVPLGLVKKGKSTLSIQMQELKEAVSARFILRRGRRSCG